jgi:hypothetical protein
MSHVHALWHLDFKDGPLPVLTRDGERKHPQLFGGDAAEEFCHGFGQATQKRGKPRSVMIARESLDVAGGRAGEPSAKPPVKAARAGSAAGARRGARAPEPSTEHGARCRGPF